MSKSMRFNPDLSDLELSKEDEAKSPQEITSLVLRNIVLNYASIKQGLQENDRRKFYKICDVFDVAIKDKLETIELEDDWMGFLRKCRKEGTMMPTKLLRKIEELLDEVKDR